MTSTKDEQAAKKLYMDYDGSRFYMSRDGVEERYLKFKISEEKESEWYEELVRSHLARLDLPENYSSAYFFVHHSDYRYINTLLGTEPKGNTTERLAYIEVVIKYLKCAYYESELTKRDLFSGLGALSDKASDAITDLDSEFLNTRKMENIRERYEAIISAKNDIHELT